MQASVSVVIPTWNRAHDVRLAIESALQQSLPVREVLVCDDGSTDGTQSVVDELARQDRRVRWVGGERGGRPAIPRNRGISGSRGEWVAFLDSDDAWYPEKLAIQMEAAHRSGTRAVCSNATRVLPDGRRSGVLLDWTHPRLTLSDLLATNWVVCSSCVLHRSLIARTGGFPEEPEFKAIEDYVLWLRIATLTDFAYCPDALVYYRDDPKASIRSEQEVSPDVQRDLVLAATGGWLLSGNMGAVARISGLTVVALARLRHSFSRLNSALRHGLGR